MSKIIQLCLIGLMCIVTTSAYSWPDRYWNDKQMIASTTQKTISETFLISANQVLILMTDGSLWMHSINFNNRDKSVNIEDFQNPQAGTSYSWVTGYDRGYDMVWTENRTQAALLAINLPGTSEALPYESFTENFEIVEIFNDQNVEILILNNNSIIVIPSHHRGFAIGDNVKIALMKEGKNAYLFRQIDVENQITIPLDRGSSYIFIGR